METLENLLQTLGNAIGTRLEADAQGMYEISVQGESILLYPQESDQLLLCFGVVTTQDHPFQRDLLAHALTLSLFGRGTQGFHLGMFQNALLLSTVIRHDTLTPESLIEELYLLALQTQSVRNALDEPFTEHHETVSPRSLTPLQANFITLTVD